MNEAKKIYNFSMFYSLVPVSGHLLNNGDETQGLLGINKDSTQHLPNLDSMLFQAIFVKQIMHR